MRALCGRCRRTRVRARADRWGAAQASPVYQGGAGGARRARRSDRASRASREHAGAAQASRAHAGERRSDRASREHAGEGTAAGAPPKAWGHPHPSQQQKRPYKPAHGDISGGSGRNPTAVLPYGRRGGAGRPHGFTSVNTQGMIWVYKRKRGGIYICKGSTHTHTGAGAGGTGAHWARRAPHRTQWSDPQSGGRRGGAETGTEGARAPRPPRTGAGAGCLYNPAKKATTLTGSSQQCITNNAINLPSRRPYYAYLRRHNPRRSH